MLDMTQPDTETLDPVATDVGHCHSIAMVGSDERLRVLLYMSKRPSGVTTRDVADLLHITMDAALKLLRALRADNRIAGEHSTRPGADKRTVIWYVPAVRKDYGMQGQAQEATC